jgi:menaquinol-cytochrome c reductase iron-sulfur subunit
MTEHGPGPAEPVRAREAEVGSGGKGGAASSGRRRVLGRLTIALSVVVGAVTVVPWLGMLFAPVRRRDPRRWRPVGGVNDFAIGDTVKVSFLDAAPLPWAGFAAESAAWLRRTGPAEFEAFSIYFTHVVCPVRWEAGAELFLCPCHGGAFHADGSVAAGPPPRPLDRFPIRIRDGVVEIQAVGIPEPG